MTLVADDLINGRYRVVERIAVGSVGEVWRGVDETHDRPVAVKILRAVHLQDKKYRARFRREALFAGSISHPGIVPAYDHGEHVGRGAEPVPYLVMELVDGPRLSDVLHAEGPLSPRRTLRIVEQTAAALQAVHDRGVIHGDLKPDNLLLGSDYTVRIIDFGAADSTPLGTGLLTGTAQNVGSEQPREQPATATRDLYALGVLAYTCLTGTPPATDGNCPSTGLSAAVARIQIHVPPLPSTVPPAVSDLVMALLETDPAASPATATNAATMVSVATAADALLDGDSEPGHQKDFSGAGLWPSDIVPLSRSGRLAGSLAPLRRWRAAHGRTGLLTAVVAAVVLVSLTAAVLTRSAPGSAPGPAVVPAMVGGNADLARVNAVAAGLRPEVRIIDVAGTAAGTVIAQHPPAGAQVSEHSVLSLTVASGQITVLAAPLIGLVYSHAAGVLQSLKLTIAQATQTTTTAAPGTVIAITPAGRIPVGTIIVLTVAAGPLVVHDFLPGQTTSGTTAPGHKKPKKPKQGQGKGTS